MRNYDPISQVLLYVVSKRFGTFFKIINLHLPAPFPFQHLPSIIPNTCTTVLEPSDTHAGVPVEAPTVLPGRFQVSNHHIQSIEIKIFLLFTLILPFKETKHICLFSVLGGTLAACIIIFFGSDFISLDSDRERCYDI